MNRALSDFDVHRFHILNILTVEGHLCGKDYIRLRRVRMRHKEWGKLRERERLPSFEVNELFAHKERDSETPKVRYRQKEEMSRERIRLYSNH